MKTSVICVKSIIENTGLTFTARKLFRIMELCYDYQTMLGASPTNYTLTV